MKAHIVPATYYKGWETSGNSDHFFVFPKGKTSEQGISKKYRSVKSISAEHSFFMEEDFYYVDFDITGISYKLKNEITDFLNKCGYSIIAEDDLAESYVEGGTQNPTVTIDTYDAFKKYEENIDKWMINDANGNQIAVSVFKTELNDYIFMTVGKLIEEDLFANYLENTWNDVRESIANDISSLNDGDTVCLSRVDDLVEFFVYQYLRVKERIDKDIEPTLEIIRQVFKEMGFTETELDRMRDTDGLLSPEPYFIGVLLDAARGDKTRVNNHISAIKANYTIDILEADGGMEYITNTNPCIKTRVEGGNIKEMIFPISKKLCARFTK